MTNSHVGLSSGKECNPTIATLLLYNKTKITHLITKTHLSVVTKAY